jgi:hypothetical protein
MRTTITGALVGLAAVVTLVTPAAAAGGVSEDSSSKPVSIAVIGDVPYGLEQEMTVGRLVGAVNDDPKVRSVVHLGDIKSGSTTCTDERLLAVRNTFASFEDPVVYTPGDNEWTDCHRANNGSYDPLERLAKVREVFFADPGTTLGRRRKAVEPQPSLVEDVRWVESQVVFATLHVIGSDNGMAPWTGIGKTGPTAAQAAEVAARSAATVDWVDEVFDLAAERGLAGVVLAMQADTFQPQPSPNQRAVIDRIAARAGSFPGEVLLLQGDSHTWKVDHPLGANVTRVVVHGETLPFEYLRLTVDRRAPALFQLERVQVG